MNGKEFLTLASINPKIDKLGAHGDTQLTQEAIQAETSSVMYGMLTDLYVGQEVHFLTDDTPTDVGSVAEIIIADEKEIHQANSYAARQQKKGVPKYRDRITYTPINDDSLIISTAELAAKVDDELTRVKHKLAWISTLMLAQTVDGISKRSTRINQGKRTVGAEVKEAVGRNKAGLVQELGNFAFIIAATSDHNGKVFQIDAQKRHNNQVLPKWLDTHNKWDSAMQRIIGNGLLEFDAYFSLLQWSVDRGVPAIPIISPATLENALIFEGAKNTNSDMLLCSLSGNTVIPIQVKNKITPNRRAEYIDDMRFLTPVELSIYQTGNRIVEQCGRKAVRPQTEIRYGALFSEVINGMSGRSAKKSEARLLDKTYAHFDRMFLPELAA